MNGIALGLSEPNKLKFKRKLNVNMASTTAASKSMANDELIFNLEEEQVTDLANVQYSTQAVSSNVRNQNFAKETGSLKLKNRSPTSRPLFRSLRLEKHVLTNFSFYLTFNTTQIQ